MRRPARTEASLRRQTAHHEAGHAVVGHALGMPVGAMWFEADGSGKTEVGTSGDHPPVDLVAVAHAGVIAGNLCGEPRAAPRPYSSDTVEAFNVECRAYPDDDEAQRRLGQRGRAKARRILRARWTSVVRVAVALERRGALSGNDVRTLLDGDACPGTTTA